MADLKEVSSAKSFGGFQKIYTHRSDVCNCVMKFGIYIPPGVTQGVVKKFPVLYNLAGSGWDVVKFLRQPSYHQYAAKMNLVVVVSDTSPRDTGYEKDKRYFGDGRSMYMDSVTEGWKDHYNMFSYITKELIQVVEDNFDFVLPGKRSIMGRSMGGHGSLLIALKRPDLYMSVSAFFPVANASINPVELDKRRPATYQVCLGPDMETWKQWDVYELMKAYEGRPLDLLVHMGAADRQWDGLKPWQLVKGAKGKKNLNLLFKLRRGQGHTAEFCLSVMEEVITYHVNILNAKE